MSSTNYRKVDKRKLSRVIILARLPREIHNKSTDKIVTKFYSLNRDVKKMLEKSIDSIWLDENKHAVRDIKYEVFFRDGDKTDLEVYLPERNKEKTRAILDFVKINECDKDVLEKNNISHLVTVKPGASKATWEKGSHPCHAIVSLPVRMVSELLHDILLDIAMFHSYPELSINFTTKIENQSKFVKMKFDFLQRKQLTNYFGALPDAECGYVNFASACRTNEGVGYNKYINLWNEFIYSIVSGNKTNSKEITSEKAILDDIVRNHKYGKQFSVKKLEAEISSLDPGIYALISTDVRPNRKEDRKKVSALMGSPNWRNNRWRIKPFSEISWYLKYCPFLAFYKFTKG